MKWICNILMVLCGLVAAFLLAIVTFGQFLSNEPNTSVAVFLVALAIIFAAAAWRIRKLGHKSVADDTGSNTTNKAVAKSPANETGTEKKAGGGLTGWLARRQAQKVALAQAWATTLIEGADKAVEAIEALPQVKEAESPRLAARNIVLKGMPAIVQAAFADGVLTVEEEKAIYGLVEHYGISCAEKGMKCLDMVAKGSLIRDLVEGNVKPRFTPGDFPFNLLKGEVPIWAWKDIPMFQMKTVKTYVRGSGGATIRIAKGVYYHAAGSRGHTESHEQKTSLGKGILGITNMHLIFQSSETTIRLKHSKIVRVARFKDAVDLYLDKGKPMWFMTDDTWFAANCLANATNW